MLTDCLKKELKYVVYTKVILCWYEIDRDMQSAVSSDKVRKGSKTTTTKVNKQKRKRQFDAIKSFLSVSVPRTF